MSRLSLATVDSFPIQALVVAGLAIGGVGFATASLWVASGALPMSVAAALATDTSDSWLEHMAPSGAIRGFQLGLIALLFGGVPAAVGAATMSRWLRGTRSSRWEAVVRGAFIFQLGSLLLTALVLGFTLFVIVDAPDMTREVLPFSAALVLSAAASAWAVWRWHLLGQELQLGRASSSSHPR